MRLLVLVVGTRIMKNSDTITISKIEYYKLLDDSNFLRCLEAAGVYDWDGSDLARDKHEDPNNEGV